MGIKNEILKELVSKNNLSAIDETRFKEAKRIKKMLKDLTKLQKNFETKEKKAKIQFYQEINIYNEEYDIDSNIYNIIIEVKKLEEELELSLQDENLKQHTETIKKLLIQERSLYTLELIKDFELSLLENPSALIETANSILANGKKVYVNLNIILNKLLKLEEIDNTFANTVILKLAKFIVSCNNVDDYYPFIDKFSNELLNLNNDKTMYKLLVENISKKD